MTTSIRLDPKAERLLRRIAKQRGQTKSEVIRAAIDALARATAETSAASHRATAYDRVAHVVGIATSNGAALSQQTGVKFRDLLAQRARARRSR
ncbi:MAG: ribbon-helix-helix protein, CopG family [Gemmatimonadaceae bacterium]